MQQVGNLWGRTCAAQCPSATYALSVRGFRLKIQIMTQDDPINCSINDLDPINDLG